MQNLANRGKPLSTRGSAAGLQTALQVAFCFSLFAVLGLTRTIAVRDMTIFLRHDELPDAFKAWTRGMGHERCLAKVAFKKQVRFSDHGHLLLSPSHGHPKPNVVNEGLKKFLHPENPADIWQETLTDILARCSCLGSLFSS